MLDRVLIVCALLSTACDASDTPPATAASSRDASPPTSPATATRAADDDARPTPAPAPAPTSKTPVPPAAPAAATPSPAAATPSSADPEPAPPLAFDETLAGLGLGMTVAQLREVRPGLAIDGEPRQVTPDSSTPGPTSYYSQQLRDGSITVEVRSKTVDGVQRAAAIAIAFDGTEGTSKGVAIGSPLRAFQRAYPKAFRPMPRQLPDEYWVPLQADAMLFVLIDAGKVYSLELGAAKRVDDIEL
ncbi:MAG: hypothetical protein IPH07_18360 [Deltaproteobacteria bacterium]|nr:hypothetical protein [Deltaproteobacteria bacterium]MBP7292523.1 hypothetical protein [Nannocystaceae bacterium]